MEVQQYLEQYNNWLYDKLYKDIQSEHPSIDATEARNFLETFLLIGNGVFWGSIIYSDEKRIPRKEIFHAKNSMNLAVDAMLREE